MATVALHVPDDAPSGREDAIDLSIIVVSYNTREMTLECLRSIDEQTSTTKYEIIVVDNASTDGSPENIRKSFPAVNLIASRENLGFARANNLAAKHARGRRLLLLNPDTVILDRAIDKLVAFADKNPECRIWGGRTVFADGTLNATSCWREMTLWTLTCFAFGLSFLAPSSAVFNPEAYGGWKRDTVGRVDIVTGCLFLIDRKLWEELGGFDPLFFMYGEEADLCHRARRAGARPTITPAATIIHYGAASDTVVLEKRLKVMRAKSTLIDRQFSPLTRVLAHLLHVLAPLTRWWIYRLWARLSHRPELAQTADVWRGLWLRRAEWAHGYSGDRREGYIAGQP
jgi:GT2 family glycosyltransferase